MRSAFFVPLLIFIISFSLVFLQILALNSGSQGVDFAIFSQVVHSVSQTGVPKSSLIGIDWHNFLTHHLSFYLIILGDIAWFFGLSSAAVLLWSHFLTLLAIGTVLFLLLKHFNYPRCLVSLLLWVLLLAPAVRVPLAWEVRDEIFSLPLLLFAYLSLFRRDYFRMFLALGASLFFKETNALFMGAFAVSAFLNERGANTFRYKVLFLSGALAGPLIFVMYSFVLPGWLYQGTFDAGSRLDFATATSPSILYAKAYWLCVTFYPVIPIVIVGLWQIINKAKYHQIIESLSYAIPPFLSLGLILVSSFPGMYRHLTYYGVVPYILTTCWILYIFRDENSLIFKKALFLSVVLTFLVSQPLRGRPEFSTSLRAIKAIVKINSDVIVDDHLTSLFVTNRKVTRLYHANLNILPFNFIVLLKDSSSRLSIYLRSWSSVCYEDSNVIVRCAYPSIRPKISS